MHSLDSPGTRLLQMYTLLASSHRAYTLKRLAGLFHCSRQTVLRMVEQLQRVRGLEIESWLDGKERVYRANMSKTPASISLTVESLRHLVLCRDIVRNILPKPLQDEIYETIGAASLLLGNGSSQTPELESFAGVLGKGTIDYTPHQDTIDGIQEAMHSRLLCAIRYRSILGAEAKSYIVASRRILVFHEALYLQCIVCDKSGRPQEDTSRTFAIQRIVTFELLNQGFIEITEPVDAGTFGFPFHDPIRVRVAFTPAVATYVSERQWSKEQWIRKRKGGGITLTFTTTSRQEVLSWVLSFGKEAKLLEPKGLCREIQTLLKEVVQYYD